MPERLDFGRPPLNRQRRPPESFFRLYIPQTQTCLASMGEDRQVFRIPVSVPYIIYIIGLRFPRCLGQ